MGLREVDPYRKHVGGHDVLEECWRGQEFHQNQLPNVKQVDERIADSEKGSMELQPS